MNEGTRNQLEIKLKEMLDRFDQVKAEHQQPLFQPGTGNIIRRRKGEKDKRFLSAQDSACVSAKSA